MVCEDVIDGEARLPTSRTNLIVLDLHAPSFQLSKKNPAGIYQLHPFLCSDCPVFRIHRFILFINRKNIVFTMISPVTSIHIRTATLITSRSMILQLSIVHTYNKNVTDSCLYNIDGRYRRQNYYLESLYQRSTTENISFLSAFLCLCISKI